MEKDFNSTVLPLKQEQSNVSTLRSKQDLVLKWLSTQWSKYSWALVLYQSLMGLLLVYLTIYRNQTYLFMDWVLGLMLLLFFTGGFYGWFVGKQTGIGLSEANNVVFQMGGQWKKFLPVMAILLSTRGILMIVDWRIDFDMTPALRSLPMCIAGMLSTRGITLFIKYFLFKREI